MKKNPIEYDYIVHHIRDGKSVGYKAIIPAFNCVVFGDGLAEIESGVALAIQEELKARINAHGKKRVIPEPDAHQTFTGKFMVRMNPALHQKLSIEAKARRKSLNAYIQEKISA